MSVFVRRLELILIFLVFLTFLLHKTFTKLWLKDLVQFCLGKKRWLVPSVMCGAEHHALACHPDYHPLAFKQLHHK
jgi:hypothetical protein